jgi:hypothetical protein
MTKHTVMIFTLLLAHVHAMGATPLPKDVAKFVERREGCDHFRGEIPEATDPERMDEINRELKKLCKGTDKKLLQLKHKYAANTTVTSVLAAFEPNIEPSPRRSTN